MSLLSSLLIVTVFALACRQPLKLAPWAFYLLAVAIAVATVWLVYNSQPNPVLRAVVFAVQKGHVGFAFFAVVMFIGVSAPGSRLRLWLAPVRAELSIIAAILICAHLTPYLANYLSLAASLLSLRLPIILSLVIALAMLVLLIPLAVTSVAAVKKRMDAVRWKRLQRLAYVFFALVYFHMLGYLVLPALNGSSVAALNLGVYTLVFAAYVILRIARALRDRKAAA
jgi:DMSO/TMAO reductase YedYZ heme-binding membrane subunit